MQRDVCVTLQVAQCPSPLKNKSPAGVVDGETRLGLLVCWLSAVLAVGGGGGAPTPT